LTSCAADAVSVVTDCVVNTLYYGDNLDVLRRHVADESADLVYLDPPFKSKSRGSPKAPPTWCEKMTDHKPLRTART